MRSVSAIVALFGVLLLGCAGTRGDAPEQDYHDPALDPLVGARVSLRGTLHSMGKFGPYLVVGKTAVYMEPLHLEKVYSYSKIYDELDGHTVDVTGTLHYAHFPPTDDPPWIAAAIDHYWFEDETVQIREATNVQ